MMVPERIELATFAFVSLNISFKEILVRRSNQLSYGTIFDYEVLVIFVYTIYLPVDHAE